MSTETMTRLNGLDLEALGTVVEEIKNDASKGFARFTVTSSWKGQNAKRGARAVVYDQWPGNPETVLHRIRRAV
jgi:hypothetical protein